MFDFSASTYRFYSQAVPVLSLFNVPDIAMRRRSICRRRTKSIVVFVFVFKICLVKDPLQYNIIFCQEEISACSAMRLANVSTLDLIAI